MRVPNVHPSGTALVTIELTEYARLFYADHASILNVSVSEYIRQMLEDVPYRALLRVSL